MNPKRLFGPFLPVCLAVLFFQLVPAQTTDALSVGRIFCPRTGDELEVLVLEGRYPTDAEIVSCGNGWIGELRWQAPPSDPDELRVNRLASLIPLGTCDSETDCRREVEKTCNGYNDQKKDCAEGITIGTKQDSSSGSCCRAGSRSKIVSVTIFCAGVK